MIKVAALFVVTDGVYFGLDGVDPWDERRDARNYVGPYPVVAHPPCKRWGRYWSGGPSAKVRRKLGDDNGCFAAALYAVRTFGGVVEHPEASHAWRWFGLPRPNRKGGWTGADAFGGRSCCVEQGHYGHKARKATWLYAVVGEYPEMIWGPTTGLRLDAGFHNTQERREARAKGILPVKRITPHEMEATPLEFRDALIALAATARTR